MANTHTFHIPVMGIGFTVDTPLKVSKYGIDSVISLVDDILLEKLRKMYSEKNDIPYEEVSEKKKDYRAKRITSYLNLIQDLSKQKFKEFKESTLQSVASIKEYFNFLPETSALKTEFLMQLNSGASFQDLKNWLEDKMSMGSIDVNIMTKVDKDNYDGDEQLDAIYNDAHAALRGFAESDLSSSVILSAGMNPRLYSYIEQFDDFFADAEGDIKKKIVLKVSDYRSALIQGKFLAKKGIWVSEYRIESGLNCGGHAFATEGHLMGPILQQFKENRASLESDVFEVLKKALEINNKIIPNRIPTLKITAQGGVGTQEEHQFLIDHYGVDSVGWGSPFMLVPEATTVDTETLNSLAVAQEEDLYLSGISPLGIPFHSLKGNTKDGEKQINIEKGRPGSSCPKRFVALNKEFSEKGDCIASRKYQYNKLKELEEQGLSKEAYQKQYDKITEKSCTCVGLGTSALLAYGLDTKKEGEGVSVCPGPNMAYFSKIMPLKEMVGHIYGRNNVISRKDRPNMFVKELQIYVDYIKKEMKEAGNNLSKKQEKYFTSFVNNLKLGIAYYKTIWGEKDSEAVTDLDKYLIALNFK